MIDYNPNIEKVKCSCEIKTNISPNYDFKFNKNDFFNSFTDIKNIININILKCYKIAFKIKDLIHNYGFYIMTSIMILFFITLFIFYFVTNKNLKKDLFNMFIILNNIKSIKINKATIKGEENPKYNKIKQKIKIKVKIKIKKKKISKHKSLNINNKNCQINNNNGIKSINNIIQKTQNERDKSLSDLIMIKILKFKSYNISIKYTKEFLELKDFEMNLLEYEEALKLDIRNYFQYYISLLKYNHPIMFSLSIYNDYNLRIIKIFLFFFSFSSDLTINALFFNDDTMHKIYQDKGEYNFLYQIPQILYSTLISRFIDTLIKNFALLQDNIIELKKENGKANLDKKYNRMLGVV